MPHKPGWKTSELWLVALFAVAACVLLWRYGAAIGDAVKGISYSISTYAASRVWLKRKHSAAAPPAAAIDKSDIAAEVVAQLRAAQRPARPTK